MPHDARPSQEISGVQEGTAPDADALYDQGMAHYRRREWRAARACFEQVRALQPNRPRLDALLHELDVLTRAAPQQEGAATGAAPGDAVRGAPVAPARRLWAALGVLLASLLLVGVFFLYRVGRLPFLSRGGEQALRNRCRSRVVAQRWCEALEACSELATRVPDDAEALNSVARAKSMLYDAAQSLVRDEQVAEALLELRCIATYDPAYRDVKVLLGGFERRQALEERYQSALAYLQKARAHYARQEYDLAAEQYDRAKVELESIRRSDATYKPEAIRLELYRLALERGACYLAWAATELVPAADVRPGEPRYVVTDSLLANLRNAARDFEHALRERPGSQEAAQALSQVQGLHSGLEYYSDWAWAESIAALSVVHAQDADYLQGKVALVLCDAYQHLGDLRYAKGDYRAALEAFESMQALGVCDEEVVAQGIEQAGLPLTPTATATPTPTQTPTPTYTPAATATPSNTPTNTPAPKKKKRATKPPPPPTPKPRRTA